jgi:hypothetical protein
MWQMALEIPLIEKEFKRNINYLVYHSLAKGYFINFVSTNLLWIEQQELKYQDLSF